MKKFVIVLSTVSLLLTAILPVAAETTTFSLGDVDGNGQIAAADALLVLQSVVDKTALTEPQQAAAKTSADDIIGAEDALCILQKVVGKIRFFPLKWTAFLTGLGKNQVRTIT